MILISLHPVFATPPDPASIRAAWESVDASHWTYRPRFDTAEFERLAAGKIVKRRERLDGADRVVAAVWTSASKDDLWIALQDEQHWQAVAGYVDEDLPGSVFADRVLYQRIGLPWPLADRQWVIHVRSNRSLLEQSKGSIWERSWDVSNRRGASLELPNAVWVEENSGGWVLCESGPGNLLVYTVRASVGGNVPDEAATQWALLTVSGVLKDTVDRATTWVTPHYVGGHSLIERPDGTMIPTRGAQPVPAAASQEGRGTP